MSQMTTASDSPSNPEMVNLFESPVLSDWIDYNGHMNDAYYVVAFSKGIDAFMVHIGLDETFRSENSVSIYTLQSMVQYLQEVSEGEPLVIKGQLLESDNKKLRLYMTMYHAKTNDVLATMETLLLHMNMKEHRAAPFLPETLAIVEKINTSHASLPAPDNAGAGIRLKRKK